ncbi:MAG: hypothetical protein PF518_17385 [Spirochaetaceae bacterium]|jgi:hypothetical protein|nr:hypothetical protein [Spirochaetaceae bacterium]
MKYVYNISEKNKLISISQCDLYSFQEVKGLINVIIKDPQYKPTYNFLIDLREIKYTPIIDEMKELSEYLISLKKHFGGVSIIISNNDVHHDLFRYAATLVSKKGLKIRHFYNPEHAKRWINHINSNIT